MQAWRAASLISAESVGFLLNLIDGPWGGPTSREVSIRRRWLVNYFLIARPPKSDSKFSPEGSNLVLPSVGQFFKGKRINQYLQRPSFGPRDNRRFFTSPTSLLFISFFLSVSSFVKWCKGLQQAGKEVRLLLFSLVPYPHRLRAFVR